VEGKTKTVWLLKNNVKRLHSAHDRTNVQRNWVDRVAAEADILMLERPPELFDEDNVQGTINAIHADLYAVAIPCTSQI